jgi:4-carboxymuconolactone decarboxylase
VARVDYPDPAGLEPATQELLAKLPPLNVFRMLAGSERLLKAFVDLGNQILFHSALDPVLRELAIIRVGVLSGSSYEVNQHDRVARSIGVPDDVIAALRVGPDHPVFDDRQRLVLRFTDDVVANVRAGDDTFGRLVETLSLREVQELTVTIGYYMLVSRFLETFGIEIEASDIGIDVSGGG